MTTARCLLTIGPDRVDQGIRMIASALADGVEVHVAWRMPIPNHGIESEYLHEISIGPSGLSAARNQLLKALLKSPTVRDSDVLCLGDDDGIWPAGNKLALSEVFAGDLPWALGTYAPSLQSVDRSRFPLEHVEMSTRMICDRASSLGIYATIATVRKAGLFDERLGVGSAIPVGEDTDFALRLSRVSGCAPYRSQLIQFHAYSPGGRPAFRLVPSLQLLIFESRRHPVLAITAARTFALCLKQRPTSMFRLIAAVKMALLMPRLDSA